MPIKILMPALSPTMLEGNVAKWLKKEGDSVSPGQVMAEIETDKAVMELESVDEGILGKILVPEGTQNVKVNSVIAILLEEGESYSDIDQQETPKQSIEAKDVKDVPNIAVAVAFKQTDHCSKEMPQSHISRIFASPLAKKIANLKNIDLASVTGTGPHGRIVKTDVESFVAMDQTNTSIKRHTKVGRIAEEYSFVEHSNMRKVIARRLTESKQNIPHFYLSVECRLDKLMEAREDINNKFAEDKVKKISVNDFVILAAAKALQEVPEANSSFSESGVLYYNNVDIAVAVALEGGLITPIIKNAEQKDIFDISMEMKELIKKAKANKLTPSEFQGGGITISNLGMYGVKSFNAIINQPQSCILAIGAAAKSPVADGDQVRVATIMNVNLSCDHRVVDGAVSARFLASFKKFIEKPVLMLV